MAVDIIARGMAAAAGSGGGGTSTDVKINNVSITNNNVANILTNSAYNENTNKIATMTDINNIVGNINAILATLTTPSNNGGN